MQSPTSVYRAFGLTLRSELPLPLPEAPSAPDNAPGAADVDIVLGQAPDRLTTAHEHGPFYFGNETDFIFEAKGVGRIHVADGRRMVIDLAPSGSRSRAAWFAMCTGMGVLLHQRRYLVLHAGAVAVGSGASVLFCGRSGAGKSTTVAALHQRGYPLLTDDICPITVSDRAATVWTGYPHARMNEDSAAALGYEVGALPLVRDEEEKRRADLTGVPAAAHTVRAVYVLTPRTGADVAVEPMTSAEAFNALYRFTYQPWMLPILNRQRAHFEQGTRLVANVPISRLVRPADDARRISELIDRIEAELTT